MSDEFLSVARQEIQSEINNLSEIFLSCTNDEQLYENSGNIEKHLHKIKGLAPMMNQEKIGEIAKISDMIIKYIVIHGVLKGSHDTISDAIKRMSGLFNGQSNIQIEDFRKHVKDAYSGILEF